MACKENDDHLLCTEVEVEARPGDKVLKPEGFCGEGISAGNFSAIFFIYFFWFLLPPAHPLGPFSLHVFYFFPSIQVEEKKKNRKEKEIGRTEPKKGKNKNQERKNR